MKTYDAWSDAERIKYAMERPDYYEREPVRRGPHIGWARIRKEDDEGKSYYKKETINVPRT